MTRQHSIVRNFIQKSQHFNSGDDLFRALVSVTRALGFSWFALGHHTDPAIGNDLYIHLHNYPPDWATYYIAHKLFRHDPVLEACNHTHLGFAWEDLPTLIRMKPRFLQIMQESRVRGGIGTGFTVPAYVPGEPAGSCSFATRSGVDLPRPNLLTAQLVGSFAFQAARRITGLARISNLSHSGLTPRQRDCVYWMTRGKTDWEIAVILGISKETVTQHLNMARARYGVARRLPLAVKAIYDGQISFLDALS